MDKLIVVFSDSHRSSFNMSEVMKRYPGAECVIHLGDGEDDTSYLSLRPETGLLTVRGNCDIMSDSPEIYRVNLCGIDMIMCHGHAFGVKYDVSRYEAYAASQNCDIALFGHTHTPYKNVVRNGEKTVTVFNPGSISRPTTGKPTYGLIKIGDDGFEITCLTV